MNTHAVNASALKVSSLKFRISSLLLIIFNQKQRDVGIQEALYMLPKVLQMFHNMMRVT